MNGDSTILKGMYVCYVRMVCAQYLIFADGI